MEIVKGRNDRQYNQASLRNHGIWEISSNAWYIMKIIGITKLYDTQSTESRRDMTTSLLG